ncbi:MAG: Co2+/Mg2+ efflux protein ApaG [Thiotrichaceae bacterium]
MTKHLIETSVETNYIEEESSPEQAHYIFSYTVTITNTGIESAKLISRHWIITDADGRIQEVRGKGVIGQQPHLKAGESYTYTSGTMMETPIGFMQGSYQMIADDGIKFDATIPAFRLAVPGILN